MPRRERLTANFFHQSRSDVYSYASRTAHAGLTSVEISWLIPCWIRLMTTKNCRLKWQTRINDTWYTSSVKWRNGYKQQPWMYRRLTWNAKMKGISNFPLWFGFGPSINFLSTKIPSLPFEATSTIVLTRLGIQAVPFGRICDQSNDNHHTHHKIK